MSKIVIISCSQNLGSESLRVSEFLESFSKESLEFDSKILDLASSALPFYSYASASKKKDKKYLRIFQGLASAEAFVFVVPEWDGMAPAVLTNLFHFAGDEFAHKPAYLIAVSSGRGGMYPLTQLRMGSFKNTRLCFLPEQMILTRVNDLKLDSKDELSSKEKGVQTRLHYGLKLLAAYAKALKLVRQTDLVDHMTFPNGI